MGRLDRIVANLEALPEDVRDAIINVVDDLIARHDRRGSLLTDAQAEEVRRRMADPGPDLSDAEADQLFEELARE